MEACHSFCKILVILIQQPTNFNFTKKLLVLIMFHSFIICFGFCVLFSKICEQFSQYKKDSKKYTKIKEEFQKNLFLLEQIEEKPMQSRLRITLRIRLNKKIKKARKKFGHISLNEKYSDYQFLVLHAFSIAKFGLVIITFLLANRSKLHLFFFMFINTLIFILLIRITNSNVIVCIASVFTENIFVCLFLFTFLEGNYLKRERQSVLFDFFVIFYNLYLVAFGVIIKKIHNLSILGEKIKRKIN
jgi:hypothetical protein